MAQIEQPQSLNSIVFGLVIGLLLPFVSFLLYFLFRIHSTDFIGYIMFLIESKKFLPVMSLSVFPNLIPFFLFINSSRFRSGRGVLGATIAMAVFIFILKIV